MKKVYTITLLSIGILSFFSFGVVQAKGDITQELTVNQKTELTSIGNVSEHFAVGQYIKYRQLGYAPDVAFGMAKKILAEMAKGKENPITTSFPQQRVCTQDAKICPDGTAVGRVGPNCEFAPCPQEVTEEKNTSNSSSPSDTSLSKDEEGDTEGGDEDMFPMPPVFEKIEKSFEKNHSLENMTGRRERARVILPPSLVKTALQNAVKEVLQGKDIHEAVEEGIQKLANTEEQCDYCDELKVVANKHVERFAKAKERILKNGWKVEVKYEGDNPKLLVKRTQKRKLFSLFNVEIQEQAEIDENGEFTHVERPWWSVFAW